MNSNAIYSTALLAATAVLTLPLRGLSQTFTKVNAGNLTSDTGYFTGCAWGDLDNDGKLDVIVANSNGRTNMLYRNSGNGNFTRILSSNLVADKGFHFGLFR
jgi:hypothetical protein